MQLLVKPRDNFSVSNQNGFNMKELVLATVMWCAGGVCEQHDIRIEKKACIGSVKTQVPHSGEWQEGKIVVSCRK